MLREYDEDYVLDIFQSFYALMEDRKEDRLSINLENTLVYTYEGDLERFDQGLWDVIVSATIRFGTDIGQIKNRISAWTENSARLAEEYQSLKARGLLH